MIFRIFALTLTLGIFISCSQNNAKIPITNYREVDKAQCDSDPEHTFHFASPEGNFKNLPLVIAIDAQGRGSLAVELLSKASIYTPAVIVGSDLIRNGYPDFQGPIEDLINTCLAKFQVDEKSVYLVGFSGGGRMAYSYATGHDIRGVIMMGAGPGSELPEINTYAICGTRDFNFMELYRRPLLQMLDDSRHLFDHFEGVHEWPDSTTLRDALLFQLAFLNENSQRFAEERSKYLITWSDIQLNSGSGLLAWKSLEKAYKLSRNADLQKEIREKCKEIQQNNIYRVSIRTIENYLKLELKERQRYIEASAKADLTYWKNEISELKEKASNSSDIWVIQHNERMKGFLGILFYTRIKAAMLSDGNINQAKILIDAFSLLEPKNADMFYFKALYQTEMGELDSASHYLALARKNGLVE